MPRNPLSEIEKKLRKEISLNLKKHTKGLTQGELSEMTGIPASTLSGYFAERSTINAGNTQIIADALGIDKQEIDPRFKEAALIISENIVDIYSRLEKPRQQKVYNYAKRQLNEQKELIKQLVYITSTIVSETGILNLDPTHGWDLEVKGSSPDHDLAFQISGSSMEPFFKDEEIIYVQLKETLSNGQIGIVAIGSDVFIKKMYLGEDDLKLVSLNKADKDIVTIRKNSIKLIGKVIF